MSHTGIKGNLDIFSEIEDGIKTVYIHGDPEGLKSFAKLLISIADENQENFLINTREHVHLEPDYDISKSSNNTIVGRLDAAKTGKFPDKFEERTKIKYRDAT